MYRKTSFIIKLYNSYSGIIDSFYYVYETFKNFLYIFKNIGLTIKYIYEIGVETLPLVFFASLFIGTITTLQADYQLRNLVPKIFLGMAVFKALVSELVPVLLALVMSSRYTSSIAAEIGNMAVSEQINAMVVLGLNPIRFLFTPRVLGGILIFPIITILSDLFSYMGAMLTARYLLNVSFDVFIQGSKLKFSEFDIIVGLVKSAVFGFIVTYVGCILGYTTKNGAKGVGRSTMNAVVWADVLVLIFDFLVALFLL